MQSSMMLFTFFVFYREYPFCANLVQNVKIISLSWNLAPRLIRICKFQWWCSLFFVFNQKYPFCANLVQNVKIISLNWNLVASLIRICRIQWYCSLFSFSTGSTIFWGKFGPKNKNYQFKLKLGIYTNSNMENSIVTFTFSVCDWKYSFRANLVQNIKIVSLKSDSHLPNKNVLFASLKVL